MKIEEIIQETLQSIDNHNRTNREEKRRYKMLSKAQAQWRQLVMDRINDRIGDC